MRRFLNATNILVASLCWWVAVSYAFRGRWGFAALEGGIGGFNAAVLIFRLRSEKRRKQQREAEQLQAMEEAPEVSASPYTSGGVFPPGTFNIAFGHATGPNPQPNPVPDLVTPVTGYRQWWFNMGTGLLEAGNNHGVWKAGENVAECYAPSESGFITMAPYGWPPTNKHPAPSQTCHCGFYAAADMENLWAGIGESIVPGSTPAVFGTAEGYGRVIVHSGGWRAEKVRVTAVLDPCATRDWLVRDEQYHRILDHLSVTYDVPILDHIPEVDAEVPSGHR